MTSPQKGGIHHAEEDHAANWHRSTFHAGPSAPASHSSNARAWINLLAWVFPRRVIVSRSLRSSLVSVTRYLGDMATSFISASFFIEHNKRFKKRHSGWPRANILRLSIVEQQKIVPPRRSRSQSWPLYGGGPTDVWCSGVRWSRRDQKGQGDAIRNQIVG